MESSPKKELQHLVERKKFVEEHNQELLKNWQHYSSLTDYQKELLHQDWDKYYESIGGSRAYKRFQKMRELWNRRDFAVVKEFAAKAKEQIDNADWEIQPPTGYDPEILTNNQTLASYLHVCNRITQIEKEGGEYGIIGF